jgi:hypothetical protein
MMNFTERLGRIHPRHTLRKSFVDPGNPIALRAV